MTNSKRVSKAYADEQSAKGVEEGSNFDGRMNKTKIEIVKKVGLVVG